jgi:glycosyltransferase 2 family protein
MKKFIAALILMLGVFFILTRVAELQDVLVVLQRGNVFFLVLALAMGLVYIGNMTFFYQSIYRVFSLEVSRVHLLKLVTASNFINIVAPTGGLSGIAIFLTDAQRTGRSKVRVTVASVLYVWFEYIGTLVLAVLGLGELASRNDLRWSEIAASLILLAGAAGIGLLLYLGARSATLLGNVLAWMARRVNRVARPFLHREYLDVERAHWFAEEVAEGMSVLKGHPNWAVRPLLFALLNKLILWLVLLFCFLAFQVPINIGTLVAGLSIANLFLIVSPTPAGLGIVEGILAVSLVSLDVPVGDATVVTVVYRAATFWLLFLVGMYTFRQLHLSTKQMVEEKVKGDESRTEW